MSAESTLKVRIENIPAGVLRSVRNGFSIISVLSEEKRQTLIEEVISETTSGQSLIDTKVLGDRIELPPIQARDAASAISVLVTVYFGGECTIDEFIDISRGHLYDENTQTTVKNILHLLEKQREILKKSLDLSSLAAETLPSLRSFNLTVDIRPKFEVGKIVDAVPIALLHIATDSTAEIWVQLTVADLAFIKDAIVKTESEARAADMLAKKILSEH